MPSTEKADERSLAAQALTLLNPPTEAMLLDAETTKAVQEFDRMFKHGPADAKARQAVLDSLGDGPPIMYTRGGGFGVSTVADAGLSFRDALLGLYVPVEAEPSWLPASQRYMHEQTWNGPVGSAGAYKRNGKLTSIQHINTTVGSESTWSGVYASFR